MSGIGFIFSFNYKYTFPFVTPLAPIDIPTEIAKHHYKGATANAIRLKWQRKVKNQIQRIRDCVQAGSDPADLDLFEDDVKGDVRKSGND
jgi:hypothetical protein